MLRFFRTIRKNLVSENRVTNYLLYAAGEILLVVIGILIALQVNNWNIDRNNRVREVKYLSNITLDLEKDLRQLDELIAFREMRSVGDRMLIDQINGGPVDDVDQLARNVFNSAMERRFIPNNTTYTELTSSGNLNLISNDSIKLLLLELEELYKENDFAIEHETYDYQQYISRPVISLTDLDKAFPIYTGDRTAEQQNITADHYRGLFERQEYKNGLFIMTFMSGDYIRIYEEIKAKSNRIIVLIEADLGEDRRYY